MGRVNHPGHDRDAPSARRGRHHARWGLHGTLVASGDLHGASPFGPSATARACSRRRSASVARPAPLVPAPRGGRFSVLSCVRHLRKPRLLQSRGASLPRDPETGHSRSRSRAEVGERWLTADGSRDAAMVVAPARKTQRTLPGGLQRPTEWVSSTGARTGRRSRRHRDPAGVPNASRESLPGRRTLGIVHGGSLPPSRRFRAHGRWVVSHRTRGAPRRDATTRRRAPRSARPAPPAVVTSLSSLYAR